MKLSTKIKKMSNSSQNEYDFAIKLIELIQSMPEEGPEHNAYYCVLENIRIVKDALKEIT